jgi:hypothetical protein
MPYVIEIFATYIPEKPPKLKKAISKEWKQTAFHHYQKEIVDMKRKLWRNHKNTK